ncbi:MAG: hypothetical protein CM15mP130_2810 [Verrucomicrobiota bacterium]|nr:MAG: hypothetical protein CM15mP130_2810 [Verrucomicrobiota bacterium]
MLTHSISTKEIQGICKAITQSVLFHLDHVQRGDPFESETARPLDFWTLVCSQTEPLSKYRIRHGEAVAIRGCLGLHLQFKVHGLATDYCYKAVKCLADMGLPTFIH